MSLISLLTLWRVNIFPSLFQIVFVSFVPSLSCSTQMFSLHLVFFVSKLRRRPLNDVCNLSKFSPQLKIQHWTRPNSICLLHFCFSFPQQDPVKSHSKQISLFLKTQFNTYAKWPRDDTVDVKYTIQKYLH